MSFVPFNTMTHGYTHTHNDQLKDFVYARQEEYFRMGREMRDQVKTVDDLKKYVDKFRKDFVEGFGGLCFDDTPLNPQITKVVDYPDYKLESIIFMSRAHTYVTGSMYIPHDVKLPGPAVLFVCGHTDAGRMDDNYQRVCSTIARAGLIVFAIDPVGQGERASYINRATGENEVQGCGRDHDAAGVPALLNGTAMARYFYCDESRAIDYMLTRTELIDPKRIGVTGNSGGGTQTTVMMMLDTRIAAAAPGTFFTSREEYMYAGQAQDSEQIWPGFTDKGYEHVTALMAMAPRPVCILATKYDFFPIEGTRNSVNEGRRFYEMFGKSENLRLAEDNFTHFYTPKLAQIAGEFFSEIFLGEKHTVDNSTFLQLTKEQMNATKTGNIRTSFPDAEAVWKDNVDLAQKLREERLALSKEERLSKAKNWLNEKVYNHRLPTDFNARIFPKMHCRVEDGYLGTTFSWYSQKRLFNYGVLIRPVEYEFNMVLPTIIAVWDEGSRAIGDHETWIKDQWSKGYQVFVLDVTGVGDVKQNPLRIDDLGDQYTKFYGTLYKLDCDMIYYGDSMAAMRVYDVLQCIEMLKKDVGLTEDMISVYCEGRYGVYGTMACFLNDHVKPIYGETLVRSAEKTMIQPWYIPYDDLYSLILPGMLKYFDYEEIMR